MNHPQNQPDSAEEPATLSKVPTPPGPQSGPQADEGKRSPEAHPSYSVSELSAQRQQGEEPGLEDSLDLCPDFGARPEQILALLGGKKAARAQAIQQPRSEDTEELTEKGTNPPEPGTPPCTPAALQEGDASSTLTALFAPAAPTDPALAATFTRAPTPISQDAEDPAAGAAARTSPMAPQGQSEAENAGTLAYDRVVRGRASTLPREGVAPSLEPPTLPGYEILQELGHGGMGVVYKARQTALKRLVALKMILTGKHVWASDLVRFRLEAEAIARLHHPNIVQLHEVGEHEGMPYFSLEYMEGGSLDRHTRGNPHPPLAAARIVQQLASAMDCAHRQYLIHRDLKPGNILLDSDGTPKITDFGLVKHLDEQDSHQTRTGTVMGTPSYMAPEQAAGLTHQIGPAADIYSLGAILYELLTGRPPFKGTSMLDTLTQVQTQDPSPIEQYQRGVPLDLRTICLKCLEKDAQRRYATAADLAEDLRRFQAGEPIQARPLHTGERIVKWVRRHPVLATLASVGTLALVVVLSVSLWFNAHLQDANAGLQQALEETEKAQRDREQAQAIAREHDARERERVAQLRRDGQHLLLEGQQAVARAEWPTARLWLTRLQARIGAEAALEDLRVPGQQLLQTVQHRLAEREQEVATRERFKKFRQCRDEALFHGTLFTGVGIKASLAATQQAAATGLALFGVHADRVAPPQMPERFLTVEEKEQISSGCYELLLILAEAKGHPLAEQTPAEQKQHARTALDILEQATRLRPPSHAHLLRRARYLDQAGDSDGAQAARKQAALVPPANVEDHFLTGDELYKHGRLVNALAAFQSALDVQPDHFWAHYFTAVCCLKLDRSAEARATLSVCLSQQPNFIWLHLLRGVAHTNLAQYPAAEADFARAAEINPQEYGLFVNRSVLRIRQRKYAAAIADLQQALQLRPEQYQPRVNLARIFEEQNKFDKALEQIEQALLHEPRLAALYRARGRLHRQLNNSQMALEAFEQAARLEVPENREDLAEDHAEQGRIHHQLKNYPAAVKAYEAALAARPDYPLVQRLRAEALLALGQYQDAIAGFDRYLATGTPVADVHRARGLARAKLGNYAGAVEDYTRALELEPNTPYIRTRRGWAYLLNARKLALRDFDEAIRLNPEDGDAWNGRGYARVLLGQHEQAVADAEEAVKRGPKSVEIYYNAACIFAQANAGLPPGSERGQEYRSRAMALLGQGLEQLPAQHRTAYWKAVVESDDALDSLRTMQEFVQLRKKYQRGGQ